MPNLFNAYNWMINTCNNPDVGYSQEFRNQEIINGICYYDCSSIIWYALLAGGYDCIKAYNNTVGQYYGNAFTTWTEAEVLRYLGFKPVKINSQWEKGDILIRNNHTEMVYQGFFAQGRTMGAHSDEVPLPDQVSINNFITTAASWEELYRYDSSGPAELVRPVIMY